MKLELIRYCSNEVSTLGKLYIDGEFECFTIEDAHHDTKVHGKTRIPAGNYRVFLRRMGTSRFDLKYSTKFRELGDNWYVGMLQLDNVPGFEGVEMHIGNSAADTDGCILVGMKANRTANDEGSYTISYSGDAFKHFYPQVRSALQKGDKVEINIHDDEELSS